MKRLTLLVLLLLTGCAELYGAREAARGWRADASDRVLENAEATLCRGVSVGAWVRRYGSNPLLAAAWRILCEARIDELPLNEMEP